MATDIFLYAGGTDPNDIRLRDPTILVGTEEPGGMTNEMRYYVCRQTQAWRLGRRAINRSEK